MNKSEELCKLLGIEPQYAITFVNGAVFVICKSKKIAEEQKRLVGKNCSIIKVYPNLTSPNNFVKLLELLTTNDLEVFFGTCKYKKTNYYCDIINYEFMTNKEGAVIDDLQELFCKIADTHPKALVNNLLSMFNGDLPIEMIDGEMRENLYCCWEHMICIDYPHVVDKIHEILEQVKQEAQKVSWEY
jgi:hypothetical protein